MKPSTTTGPLLGIAIASLVALGPSPGRAAQFTYATAAGNFQFFPGSGFTVTAGTVFDVNNPLTINSVGVFDFGNDGLMEAHEIGIWNAAGSLLASANIPAGTTASLRDGFRWVDLSSPLTLSAERGYVIGAEYTATDSSAQADILGTRATIDSNFTLVRNALGSGFGFPGGTQPGISGFFGPNMSGSTASVPEPASWVTTMFVLLPIGIYALCRLRKSERRDQ